MAEPPPNTIEWTLKTLRESVESMTPEEIAEGPYKHPQFTPEEVVRCLKVLENDARNSVVQMPDGRWAAP